MSNDIEYIGGDPERLYDLNPGEFMNIRFKFDNVILLDVPQEIDPRDENIINEGYVLYPKRTYNFKIKNLDEHNPIDDSFKNTDMVKRVFKGEQEYSPHHNIMQNILYRILKEKHNDYYHKVFMEDNWIDISAITYDGEWHFYELKTDNPKLSIRKGIGQLLEYAYFPNYEKTEKLIIVSDSEPSNELIIYLVNLRNKFNLPVYYRYIPVYYRYIDVNKEILSEEY